LERTLLSGTSKDDRRADGFSPPVNESVLSRGTDELVFENWQCVDYSGVPQRSHDDGMVRQPFLMPRTSAGINTVRRRDTVVLARERISSSTPDDAVEPDRFCIAGRKCRASVFRKQRITSHADGSSRGRFPADYYCAVL
uniref:C2H2-type domain-containing protein n=1 Tax=Gongylonema pulchrum TaxID=637853 RepID=A0A183E2R1_9BILA